jgi:hypothetical protein
MQQLLLNSNLQQPLDQHDFQHQLMSTSAELQTTTERSISQSHTENQKIPESLDKSSQSESQLELYDSLVKAYRVLKDPSSRKEYDLKLAANRSLSSSGIIHDEVHLDELDFDEGNTMPCYAVLANINTCRMVFLESRMYSMDCRCGGLYSISEKDVEGGMEIAPCDSCSLRIMILPETEER